MRDLTHIVGSLSTGLAGEVCAKLIDPEAYAFVANINTSLVQKVLNISKREWKAHANHDREMDDLR